MAELSRRVAPERRPASSSYWAMACATLCTIAMVPAIATVGAGTPTPPPQPDVKAGSPTSPSESPTWNTQARIREGTRITDQVGVFRMTGDRVTFFSADGQMRLVGLENLNLERIVRAVNDNLGQQQWAVSGAVTEYQGANYLLVDRAVLKTQLEVTGEKE